MSFKALRLIVALVYCIHVTPGWASLYQNLKHIGNFPSLLPDSSIRTRMGDSLSQFVLSPRLQGIGYPGTMANVHGNSRAFTNS